jgi:hypothetical protein
MKNLIEIVYCALAGITVMSVGAWMGFTPVAYLTGLGADNLASAAGLLNDLRGMGGMMLVLGAFIALGAWRQSQRQAAVVVAVLIYAAFTVFRPIGFMLDGQPQAGLMIAWTVELIFALCGWAVLARQNQNARLPGESIFSS